MMPERWQRIRALFEDALDRDPGEARAWVEREAADDPSVARNAPYSTPVRRLDEAAAAKHPVIRQPL